MRVCGTESVEVAAYARCLAQMSEDYSRFLSPGLPRPFYMPNPVPLYRQTLGIIEKVIGPDDPSVSRALTSRSVGHILRHGFDPRCNSISPFPVLFGMIFAFSPGGVLIACRSSQHACL